MHKNSQSPRSEYELPSAEYRLVQTVKQRLGFVAASSLTCYLFGETQRLAAVSGGEAALIWDLAHHHGVSVIRPTT